MNRFYTTIGCFLYCLGIGIAHAAIPSVGLMGYYPLDNGAEDSSGNGNHGTLYGAVPTEDRFGRKGNALAFDGIDDYISIDSPQSFAFNQESVTLSVWVQLVDNANVYRSILTICDDVDFVPFMSIYKARSGWGGGGLTYSVLKDASTDQNVISTQNGEQLPKGDWIHVAGVVDIGSDQLKLYINGQLDTSVPLGAVQGYDLSSSSLLKFFIGKSGSTIGAHFKGSIDDVLIYNRALSDNDISLIYGQTADEDSKNRVAFYPFNGNVLDVSGRDHHATNTGATFIADRYGNDNGALTFDGVSDSVEVIDSSDFRFANESFSMSAWVKLIDNSDYYRTLVNLLDDDNEYPRATLYKGRSGWREGRLVFELANDAVSTSAIAASVLTGGQLPKDEWIHMVGVVDMSTLRLKLYVNGELNSTSQVPYFTFAGVQNLALYIGKSFEQHAFYHNDAIDDVQIYDYPLSDSQIVQIFNSNQPPTLDAIGSQSINEGENLNFVISATDPDGHALTFSASNLPPNATFDPINRVFDWTPGFGDDGSYEVTFIVVDDGNLPLSDQETITISVGNVNQPPALDAIGPQSVDEVAPLTINLTASDPDGDLLSFSASNVPSGAVFDPSTQTFTWTPSFDDSGDYSVLFNVVDNGLPALNDQESVMITVGNVNRPPILDPVGNRSVTEGELIEFTVTARDLDGDSLTFSAENLPEGATFNPVSQVFSWTPDYDDAGNYSDVEFIVVDDAIPLGLDAESIVISVGNVNRPPIIDPVGEQSVSVGELLTFSIAANDPDGDVVTLSTGLLPSGANFDSTTGQFTWATQTSQAGDYLVDFHATDDGSPTLTSMLSVPVTVGENPTPLQRVRSLIQSVNSLGLAKAQRKPLVKQLKKAQKRISQGKAQKAVASLGSFADQVNTLVSEGFLTAGEGDDLIDAVNQIISVLE